MATSAVHFGTMLLHETNLFYDDSKDANSAIRSVSLLSNVNLCGDMRQIGNPHTYTAADRELGNRQSKTEEICRFECKKDT